VRITYAVPRYLPRLGGIENHVAALARGMSLAGHQVTVLTQQEGAPAPPEEVIDGVIIERFPSMLSVRGQGLSPRLWQTVRRLEGNTDILHIHNVHAASTLGVLMAARPGAIVVTPHYLGSGDGLLTQSLHRLYDPPLGKALGKATAVICVSRAEAAELIHDLRVNDARIRVIPNGVDVAGLRAAAPADATDPVVLVAGRLEKYKQAAVVVAAMTDLSADYSLVIAGTGPEADSLVRLAARSGVSSRVHLTGQLTPAELRRWYRRATVVVSMSQRECFGMTLAEGLAAGCAVVASDIPAHREVVESAGWDTKTLISPGASGADVAAAIVYAAGARRGFEPAVMTWDDVVKETLSLYEETTRRSIRARSPR
jgi:glycosyltransferase involved in cell wall biosynthesis